MAVTELASSQWLMTEPQLEVMISLDESSERASGPRRNGDFVRLPIRSDTLWGYVTQKIDSWWSVRWTTTHGV